VSSPTGYTTSDVPIKGLYGDGQGVSSWRSTEMSIENLVKRVASLVYRDAYTESDLQQRLVDLSS
jgi:hypothetical protein